MSTTGTTTAAPTPSPTPSVPTSADLVAGLYRDGIVGLPGLFAPEWADRLAEDFEAAFAQARSIPNGTVGRGPNRYYFAVHPEQVRGFVDLTTHPRVAGLCEELLGPDYRFIELGFDVPLAGAVDQPWHRDFRVPPGSGGRLTSLAFNVTTVDVTPGLAPFEIAPGTHTDTGDSFDHGMFVPKDEYGRYEALASRRYPRRGDVSARTGLTVHRGTTNHTDRSRAVLILGAVTGDTPESEIEVHDLRVTAGYHRSLPSALVSHLRCTVVDRLEPIVQKHDIEGLVMG